MAFSYPHSPGRASQVEALLKQLSGYCVLLIGVLILALALAAPLLGLEAGAIDRTAALNPPLHHWQHPLGTDDLGRNVLARLSVGAQLSLGLGVLTGFISVGFGAAYGLLSAMAPPWLDTLLTRWMDVLASLPTLMLVLLLAVFLTPALQASLVWCLGAEANTMAAGWAQSLSLILALAALSWPEPARLCRTEAKRLLQEAYIEASRSMGAPVISGLVLRHLLPNLQPYLLLGFTLTVPRALLTESTLSFIGLGVEAPLSSWGTLASEGWQLLRVAPWLLAFPGLCLLSCMLALQAVSQRFQQKT